MIKVLELFGGIGACSKALDNLGIDYKIVDYVEIDKYAVKSFNAMHGTDFIPQDIKDWDKDLDVDLIMHGSPCQDFSLSGKQAGGNEGSGTRSSLMYETIRIVQKLKPKYVIWENVKNLLSKKHKHNFDKYVDIMREGGYNSYYQVLNAKNYGIPQNRERVFTVSIRADVDTGEFTFPAPIPLELKLKDMLEDNVDEKYYLSDSMINYISASGTENFKNHDSKINLDVARPLTTIQNKRAGTTNYLSEDLPSNYDLSLHIKTANKKGYDEAKVGDSVSLAHPNSTTRRGRVGHQVSQTIDTTATLGVVVKSVPKKVISKRLEETIQNNDLQEYSYIDCYNKTINNSGTVSTITSRVYDNNHLVCDPKIRIRRLTPRECWRLMGFSDTDFNKAKSTGNSDTQLYKQAGNSIVVDVLEAILSNLIS